MLIYNYRKGEHSYGGSAETNTVSPPLDSSPESKNKRGDKKMNLNSNRASGEPLTTDIEKAIEGWIKSLLEELADPVLTEEEKKELEEELAEIT